MVECPAPIPSCTAEGRREVIPGPGHPPWVMGEPGRTEGGEPVVEADRLPPWGVMLSQMAVGKGWGERPGQAGG